MRKISVTKWPEKRESGSKRANIALSEWLPDWFFGYGKDTGCTLEGTWWDMICYRQNRYHHDIALALYISESSEQKKCKAAVNKIAKTLEW